MIKHFGNILTILVDSFGQQLSRLLQKGEQHHYHFFATYLNLKMARLQSEKISCADPTLKSPTPTSRRVSASNVLRLGHPAVCRVGLALTLTTVDRRVSLSRTISSRGVVSVESAFMTPSPRSCACRFLLAAALHFTAGTESAHDPHYDVNTITSGAGRNINRYPI